jgi:hypothetical protein
MLDMKRIGEMYDSSVELGLPPVSFAIYDRRHLFPRSMVVDQIHREVGQLTTLDKLDEMAADGLLTWIGGAGEDGTELGLPLYVPSRIGLFLGLEAKGWAADDLRDIAEWEEWMIDDSVGDPELSYEDNDVLLVARQVSSDISQLNTEIWGRLPVDQRPDGWVRTTWNGSLAEIPTHELEAKRERLKVYLRRVESTDLTSSSKKWHHHIRRSAYCVRFRDEMIRVMLIGGDRKKPEAGFSPAVRFRGEHSLLPDTDRLEDFGRVDWVETLQYWRFLDDPDHFPIRLPGFVVAGGRVTFDPILSPDEYARRFELFSMADYLSVFNLVAGERRCAQCGKLLKREANKRRRYCSGGCSQAFRQKTYRQRQKAMILRRQTPPPA